MWYLIVSIPDLCTITYFHCFHSVYHEDGISVLGTDRRQKEPYQENMGDEEEFSNPHSVAAVMVTCAIAINRDWV